MAGPTAHSRLGASSAKRWMTCPGSIRMQAGKENITSEAAAEGTAAHELGEMCLRLGGGINADDYLGHEFHVDEFTFEVNDEMAEAVQVYIDTVRNDRVPGDTLMVEHRFQLRSVHEDMFGTNDASQLAPAIRTLRVYDYKHGKGFPVEVRRNPQLMYYALGAITGLPDAQCVDTIELIIVQPRCPHKDGPVRRWSCSLQELLDWEPELKAAAEATEDPNAPLCAGDHCIFCLAQAECPELKRYVLEQTRADFDDLGELQMPEVKKLDPTEIGRLLDIASTIGSWLRAVQAHAKREADAGRKPDGYKLVPSRPVRKWTNEAEAIAALRDYGVDDDEMFSRTLLSPAKIEGVIGKKNIDVVADCFEKVSSGTTLAPDEDVRIEVNPSAESDFKDLEIPAD